MASLSSIQGTILTIIKNMGNTVTCNPNDGPEIKFTAKAFIVQQDDLLQKQIDIDLSMDLTDKSATVFLFDGTYVGKISPGMQIQCAVGFFIVGPEIHPEYLQDICLYIAAPAYKS